MRRATREDRVTIRVTIRVTNTREDRATIRHELYHRVNYERGRTLNALSNLQY